MECQSSALMIPYHGHVKQMIGSILNIHMVTSKHIFTFRYCLLLVYLTIET